MLSVVLVYATTYRIREVDLAELGDATRFGSAKPVVADAGLAASDRTLLVRGGLFPLSGQ
ncbi:MAG: hypothetical protein NVSMB9_32390 [Isosphaeraceae bacterium]